MFRLVLALGALLLPLVPVALGQAPSVAPDATLTAEVQDLGPDGRLMPESELAEVKLVLAIACEIPPATGAMTIDFSVAEEHVPYASIIISPARQELTQTPEECADPSYRSRVESTALVTTTRDAPAVEVFKLHVQAIVDGAVDNYGPFQASFDLTNDFLPLTQVVPTKYFQKASQGELVRFPIMLANLGNGAVEVRTTIFQPNTNKLDEIVPPALVRLESRAQEGSAALSKQDVEIQARAPRGDLYTNTIYSFNAEFLTRSSQANSTEIDSTTVVLSIQVQGVGAGTPGPSLLAVLLVAAAVVAFRRRKA